LGSGAVTFDFLVDAYATERLKVLSVWSEFLDQDLPVRPHTADRRGRSVHEQMVHQCVSEDLWFRNMLGIDVGAPPLPTPETRLAFITQYAADSGKRWSALQARDEAWWSSPAQFFDTERAKAWVMVRRLTHTSHHRGQLTTMLRMLGRSLHSTYGPTADTGGLAANGGRTIYAYRDLDALIDAEQRGGSKTPLPGGGERPVTERPT
jgi:uncharacterized damage-inducible protein DinB